MEKDEKTQVLDTFIVKDHCKKTSFTYQLPRELCHFSIAEDKQLTLDKSKLRYYDPSWNALQHQPINLFEGFENNYVCKEVDNAENLDKVFKTLSRGFQSHDLHNILKHVNLMTWRGILTKLLCTPYSHESWKLNICMVHGIMYIIEHDRPVYYKDLPLEQQKNMYLGRRFEIVATLNHMQLKKLQSVQHRAHLETVEKSFLKDLDEAKVVDHVQYGVITKTRLSNLNIIFGAEVDCKDARREFLKEVTNYVEIKTTIEPDSSKSEYAFYRFKLLKFWAQSYLLGNDTILLGRRDRLGNLIKMEEIRVSEIPNIANKKYQTLLWDPGLCLSFATNVLNWAFNIIAESESKDKSERIIYHMEYSPPFKDITLSKGWSDDSFVPTWWINMMTTT